MDDPGTEQTKRCPRCGIPKRLSEFHRSKGERSGLQCWCKGCIRGFYDTPERREAHRRDAARWWERNRGWLNVHYKLTRRRERTELRDGYIVKLLRQYGKDVTDEAIAEKREKIARIRKTRSANRESRVRRIVEGLVHGETMTIRETANSQNAGAVR